MRQLYFLPNGTDNPRARAIAKQRLIFALDDLDQDRDWQITVSEPREPASDLQLGYYHAVVVRTMARETGHSEKEMRDIWAIKFLPMRIVEVDGKEHAVPTKPEDHPKALVAEFIDRCIAQAADMGVRIPPPVRSHE